MNACGAASSGDTSSMLKPARRRTERFIMDSAMRMKARGMGSFCSSASSTISSRSRAKGLSRTCARAAAPTEGTPSLRALRLVIIVWNESWHTAWVPPHLELVKAQSWPGRLRRMDTHTRASCSVCNGQQHG